MEPDRSPTKPGLLLPRLTPKYLESLIVFEAYAHFPETRTTVINVKLDCDFSITCDVVCTNPALYNEEDGKQRAKKKVLELIYEKEYYALRKQLSAQKKTTVGKGNGN
jgi:hypothetical protein